MHPVSLRLVATATALLAVLACPLATAQDAARSSVADASLSNAYAATVPVGDEGEEARQRALRNALQVVITTVSGGMPGERSLLDRAESVLSYYGYVRDSASNKLLLQAEFDRHAVNNLMRDAGLPIFGIKAADASSATINVEGVVTTAGYGRVLNYLEGLPEVQSVVLRQAADGALQLTLAVSGGEAKLTQLAYEGNVLRPLSPGNYLLMPGS